MQHSFTNDRKEPSPTKNLRCSVMWLLEWSSIDDWWRYMANITVVYLREHLLAQTVLYVIFFLIKKNTHAHPIDTNYYL